MDQVPRGCLFAIAATALLAMVIYARVVSSPREPRGNPAARAFVDIELRDQDSSGRALKGVTIDFRDSRGEFLAAARSTRGAGVRPVHPDPKIADCQQAAGQADTSACLKVHQAWCAEWAYYVKTGDLKFGDCELPGLPVVADVETTTGGPDPLFFLRHGSNIPHQYFHFSLKFHSKTCSRAW